MNIQTQIKEKNWKDESAAEIPVNRITKSEKLREKLIYKAALEASNINKQMSCFKANIRDYIQQMIDAVVAENEGKALTKKGNITIYNFDRSIKVETNVNDRIDFDDVTLALSKQKIDEMVNSKLSDDEDFMKEIAIAAFETTKGKPDYKSLMKLKNISKRSKNPLLREAMELLDKSIRRPDSRSYYRIWVRDANGKYQNIDLNFSTIEA